MTAPAFCQSTSAAPAVITAGRPPAAGDWQCSLPGGHAGQHEAYRHHCTTPANLVARWIA